MKNFGHPDPEIHSLTRQVFLLPRFALQLGNATMALRRDAFTGQKQTTPSNARLSRASKPLASLALHVWSMAAWPAAILVFSRAGQEFSMNINILIYNEIFALIKFSCRANFDQISMLIRKVYVPALALHEHMLPVL